MKVMVGSYHIPYGEYYDVESIISHENYNDPPFGNDIALVKLSRDLTLTDRVVKIELHSARLPDENGLELEFTGWRRRTVRSFFIAYILLYLSNQSV